MTNEERQRLVDRYAEGPAEVARSLEGFPNEHLKAHPIPGKWSACEIVQHLADSESISALRLRKLIAEHYPVIQGYDQEAYAQKLRYNEREIGPALEIFGLARSNTVPLLRLMSEEDWRRPAWHTESGPYNAESWLEIYSGHAHDHAGQIRRLSEALGRGQ